MAISPSQTNATPTRPAPRPPAIQTSYSKNLLDRGPPTPGTPASIVSNPSPSFAPTQQPLSQPQQSPTTFRPTPQLTPPTSSSSPNGTGSSTSTTAVAMSQKFTPQRAAPLNPSQRQEQITREAERRRRERQERENKELPTPVQPKPLPAAVPAPAATPAPSRLPVAVNNNSTRTAEATAKPVVKPKAREQRISALTEAQIMEKLRSVVTNSDPNSSYTKIKKVGQGASGSVYVARYTNTTPLRTKMVNGTQITQGCKVAIKQMDLANQPRKELIVNEILVMKESQHPNIVNFLDSYLVRGNELWVVMEFMEGGALTDVIDHNTLSEDQISCISLEVPTFSNDLTDVLDVQRS